MSPESAIDAWLKTPLGERVLRAEEGLAAPLLEDVFGFELLQIGRFGPGRQFLNAARTQHSTLLAEESSAVASLCADPTALPFADATVDAVLLPHALELAADPYAILREAVRVLRPEGHLVACGFNPYSGWGARRTAARYLRGENFPPDVQRMVSTRRLRDWVSVLGCEVAATGAYLGRGAYFLKARKRVLTLTMLRPKWRSRQRLRVGAAEPTTRVIS
jgi:SAM-dependent methyltransferase